MRTIHGNIIDEENLAPKPNTEYIYLLNVIWIACGHENIPVEVGTIVENVEQLEAGDYSFNIKGQSEKYMCSYGWAFLENNEESKKALKLIEIENQKIAEHNQNIANLKCKLNYLYNFKTYFNKFDEKRECR